MFLMDDVAPRRNEAVFGTKVVIGKQVGAITTTGDDAKTFQAAIIEYTKDQPATKVHYFVIYNIFMLKLLTTTITTCV